MSKVLVIGGGPAGCFAAIAAAEQGHQVVLLERNEKIGKKLFITGKGRCNLTNACDTEELFSNIPRNSKFLYSAIYSYDNFRVMDFFEQNGTPVKVERGNRVFPVSLPAHMLPALLCFLLLRKNHSSCIFLHRKECEDTVPNLFFSYYS